MIRSFLLITLVLCSCKSKEEQLREAEEEAQFKTSKSAAAAKGVGEALKNDGKNAAESLGEGLGNILKGAAKGLNESLETVKIEATPKLETLGIKLQRATRPSSAKPKISVYLVFEKAAQGKARLRALDVKGVEVGRTEVKFNGKAEEAKWIDFSFDSRTPFAQIEQFEIDIP